MSEARVKVSVKQGRVHVNAVLAHTVHDDVIVLDADCRAKRYEVVACEGENGKCGVTLGVNENTLHAEPPLDPNPFAVENLTFITLDVPWPEWRVEAGTGRYSVTICAFRVDRPKLEQVWDDGED